MPDTRSSNQVSEMAAAMEELRARTESLETNMRKQMEETSTINSTIKEMMEMMRSINSRLEESHLVSRRAEKQPAVDHSNSPPLLPTPGSSTLIHGANSGHRQQQHITPNDVTVEDSSSGTQIRLPKLEIPMFFGDDVEGWLFQLRRYFEHHVVPVNQRLTVATFHMSGEALKWLQWLYATQQVGTWDEFQVALRERFGPPMYWNAEVMINKLQHTTTMGKYIADFESLSTQTPGLSPSNLLHRFMTGLKEDVHREIVLLCPETLQRAMRMARISEQKLQAIQASQRNFSAPKPPWTQVESEKEGLVKRPSENKGTTLPIKKLSLSEMAERRQRGLCFNCDERFIPGHKCKLHFQCFIVEEAEYEPIGAELLGERPEMTMKPMDEVPNISFHALLGNGSPHNTLRFLGRVANQEQLVEG